MPVTSTDILSLISLSTVLWLAVIVIAAVTGLFIGGAGRLNRSYDADSEKLARMAREMQRRRVPGQRSEPDLVLITPTEIRKVKRV